MNKRTFLLLVVLFVCMWYLLRDKYQKANSEKTQPHQFVKSQSPEATRSPAPVTTPSPSASDQKLTPRLATDAALDLLKAKAPLKDVIPRLESVRAEIAKDPHATPLSLLKFSAELESRMQLALRSESSSRMMMGDLKDCALPPRGRSISSISAICILSAQQIASKYPALKSDADSIEAQADPDSKRVYKSLKLLGVEAK